MIDIDYTKVRNHIIARTKMFNSLMFDDETTAPTKAQQIGKLIGESNLCDIDKVAQMFTVLLEEKVTVERSIGSYPHPLACIRLLKNPNDHNYPLKEILIYSGNNNAFVISYGGMGNTIPRTTNEDCFSKVLVREIELVLTDAVINSMYNSSRRIRGIFHTISSES